MAKTKLTLSVDASIVRRAKRFSERHGTSVSELVSSFLASLEDEREVTSPVVSRLRGVLPGGVSREEYRAHLEEKHR